MILTDDQLSKDVAQRATFQESLDIIKQLEAELANSKTLGVGLAAPQIGIDKAVAIIRVPNVDGEGRLVDPSEPTICINLVNPVLLEGEGTANYDEGCLSFPGKCVKTIRYKQIIVESDIDDYAYYANKINTGRYPGVKHPGEHDTTILNQKRKIAAYAEDINPVAYLTCICIQHEFSHLLGLTMFDFKPQEFGRNDACPCGSNKKNKKCHDMKHFNSNLNKLFSPQYR